MFKLTTKEQKTKDEYGQALRIAREELDEVYAVTGNEITAAVGRLNDAIARYNEILGDARAFVEAHAAEWREAYDDKSDAWRDGDKGTAASTLVEQWESAAENLTDIDEVEVDEPDNPGDSYADDVDQLASETEQ